jgi:hypothetical protein
MEDILGREIHDGNMCIYMGIGQYSHMHIGVFMGKSMYFLSKDNTLCRGNYTNNMYLLENLSETEIKIKDKVLELLSKEEEEKEKRKSEMKAISSSKLIVGGVYETVTGEKYIYLGNRTYTFEIKNENYKCVKSGHCFSHLWRSADISNISQNEIVRFCYFRRDAPTTVTVIKTKKKFVKFLGAVNISFPFVVEGEHTFLNAHWNAKVTIE